MGEEYSGPWYIEEGRFSNIMKKVDAALQNDSMVAHTTTVLEDDPLYQLIVDCNNLLVDIENKSRYVHSYICYKYCLKFPELGSLVQRPIDRACVVRKIGHEADLTLLGLEELLPPCDRARKLDLAKKKVLDFVDSRMAYIAPNLSAIIGSVVAAKLMRKAGDLHTLAKLPELIFQLLGTEKDLAGFSTAKTLRYVGYIEETEIFQSTPPALRVHVCQLLASRSTGAACIDCKREDPTGKTGRDWREDIREKIEKWQVKPPLPDPEPHMRRGGRRRLQRGIRERRHPVIAMWILADRLRSFGTNRLGH